MWKGCSNQPVFLDLEFNMASGKILEIGLVEYNIQTSQSINKYFCVYQIEEGLEYLRNLSLSDRCYFFKNSVNDLILLNSHNITLRGKIIELEGSANIHRLSSPELVYINIPIFKDCKLD
jgi:hypothetical protein